MKEQPDFFEEKQIDLEASEWVIKQSRKLTAEEQDAFLEWYSNNPRNREWYKRHLKTWQSLNELAQWKPEHSDKANPNLLKYKKRWSYWASLGGIAASVLLGILVVSRFEHSAPSSQDDNFNRSYVAKSYEEHHLPDGSIVEMRAGAAMKLNYTKEQRRVDLVSSEAHFDVKSDPEHPFIVVARGMEYKAVGTAFNVKVGENTVELLVIEGKVEASRINQNSEKKPSPGSASQKVEVVAGQISFAYFDELESPIHVEAVSDNQINEILQWKQKSIQFMETPLQEVVDEFNQRNEIQIILGDDSLKPLLMVASFHSADADKLVGLLEATFDLKSHKSGNQIILKRRTDSDE